MEWEKWENENAKYQENKESETVENFDDPEDSNEIALSEEDITFLEQELIKARKEMMCNNQDEHEMESLDISNEELEWLKAWMDED